MRRQLWINKIRGYDKPWKPDAINAINETLKLMNGNARNDPLKKLIAQLLLRYIQPAKVVIANTTLSGCSRCCTQRMTDCVSNYCSYWKVQRNRVTQPYSSIHTVPPIWTLDQLLAALPEGSSIGMEFVRDDIRDCFDHHKQFWSQNSQYCLQETWKHYYSSPGPVSSKGAVIYIYIYIYYNSCLFDRFV